MLTVDLSLTRITIAKIGKQVRCLNLNKACLSYNVLAEGWQFIDSKHQLQWTRAWWSMFIMLLFPVLSCTQWRIDSAATSTYEIGNPPDHRGQACMKKHDVPMRHVARQVRSPTSASTPFMFSVVAVGHRQWCHIRLEHRQLTRRPWVGLPAEAWHWNEPQGPTGTPRCPVDVKYTGVNHAYQTPPYHCSFTLHMTRSIQLFKFNVCWNNSFLHKFFMSKKELNRCECEGLSVCSCGALSRVHPVPCSVI